MTRIALLALLLAVLLSSEGAAQFKTKTPAPAPLCRVEAIYSPRWASEFGSLLVRLLPGCPGNGYARIRLGTYGGPGSKATGPTETLTPNRPALVWAAQPVWRTVLWEARSGIQYNVPIQGR